MGKIIARVAALAGALVAASCATASFQPIDFASLPGPDDWPDATAVVLLDEQIVDYVEVGGEAYADVTVHTMARLLQDRGRFIQRVERTYLKSFEEIVSFDARAVTPDGRVHVYDKAKATDTVAQPEWVLFSDGRSMRVSFPALPLGSVVELQVKMRLKEPVRFPFFHAFEDRVPVEKSRFEVRWPQGWAVEADAWQRGARVAAAPQETTIDGKPAYVWERTKLPALPDEERAPAVGLIIENVGVRLARYAAGGAIVEAPRDDVALSKWLHAFVAERSGPAKDLGKLHAALVQGAPQDDVAARARRLYVWTQEKVQYCAVAVGDGAWVPHAPDQVADLRYGDCKDKAALLKELLALEGVTSELAIIAAHDGLPRPFRFPTLTGNFNHMILRARIDGQEVLLDPTSRTVPFGRLPVDDQGAEYLVLSAQGAPLQRTPLDGPDVNGAEHTFALALAADGAITGTSRSALRGVNADHARSRLLVTAPRDLDDAVDAWIELLTRGGGVDNPRIEGGAYDGVDRPVVVAADVRARGALSGGAGARLLSASSLLARSWPRLPPEPRQTPVVLGPARRTTSTVTLTLPPGLVIAHVPEPVEIDRPVGRYRVAWTKQADGLTLVREVELRQQVVAPADVEALRAFAAEADAADGEPVILTEVAR